MRVLLAHRFLPGHFGAIAQALAAAGHEVVLIHELPGETPPGCRSLRVAPARGPAPSTHPYLQAAERAVLLGQAAFRGVRELAAQGFRPDVVYAHVGFGMALYLKDALPGVPLVAFAEWFWRAHGADADFLDEPDDDDVLRIRTLNAPLLAELEAADRIVAPTAFQRDTFPAWLQSAITVLHDGIDTDWFAADAVPPQPRARLPVMLPADAELITYATRGLEPYRGFPQLIAALERLLPARPRAHAIIAGADRTFYGRRPPSGDGWRAWCLERHPALPRERVHFVETLPVATYRDLLAASDVHVYLTVPFVLSWSLLEAMAIGAPLVASATAPVREVVRDGREALLVELREPAAIAAGIGRLLDDRPLAERLARAARRRVLARYARAALLPRHLALLTEAAGRRQGPARMRTGATTSSRSIVGRQSAIAMRTA